MFQVADVLCYSTFTCEVPHALTSKKMTTTKSLYCDTEWPENKCLLSQSIFADLIAFILEINTQIIINIIDTE